MERVHAGRVVERNRAHRAHAVHAGGRGEQLNYRRGISGSRFIEAAGDDHPVVCQLGNRWIPAAHRHIRLGGPGLAERIEGIAAQRALEVLLPRRRIRVRVAQIATRNENPAVAQYRLAGAPDVLGGRKGMPGARHRIPDIGDTCVRCCRIMVFSGLVRPEQHLAGVQQYRSDADYRDDERRAPLAGRISGLGAGRCQHLVIWRGNPIQPGCHATLLGTRPGMRFGMGRTEHGSFSLPQPGFGRRVVAGVIVKADWRSCVNRRRQQANANH
ncbi:hypothetical protein CBM2589_U40013 [Cupriavidus taiwanensis]|uniref:Uncharacterized protein n=1 Tax=Cupriavidus taiwanensis TaxID=164546 RepID=A0A375CSA1_9BURK|nr:hypothetical protein CBM2589_U40013 [Cupriavidus taiwanensis]